MSVRWRDQWCILAPEIDINEDTSSTAGKLGEQTMNLFHGLKKKERQGARGGNHIPKIVTEAVAWHP